MDTVQRAAYVDDLIARIDELEGFKAAVIREYNQQVSVIFPSIEAALMKEDTP
jgi:hypothetical protein